MSPESTKMVNRYIQTAGGILVRCQGGPLDGRTLRVPILDETFTLEPEDNHGKGRGPTASLRQRHAYQLVNLVAIDGVPMYRHVESASNASHS